MVNSPLRARAKQLFDTFPAPLRSAIRVGAGFWQRGNLSGILTAARLVSVSSEAAGRILTDRAAGDPRAAIELTNERLLTYGYYARLGQILRRLNVSLALDCGAHEGYFGSQLCGYGGFNGVLVSFEPVSRFHTALAMKAAMHKNWITVNAAIGASDGLGVIHVGKGHGGTSSMLPQTEALADYAPDALLGEDECIKVVRLDTFLDGREIAAKLDRCTLDDPGSMRIFLKLDVQGAEDVALRSVGRYMDRVALIQIEMSGVEFYQGQASFGDLCKMICDKGYAPILIHNNFTANSLTHVDFDVLCCRADLVAEISRA